VNPKNRKLYNQSKAEALDKVRAVEKDFLFDVAAHFKRKTKAREKKSSSCLEVNVLKKLVAFSGGVVTFDGITAGWLGQFKALLYDYANQLATTYLEDLALTSFKIKAYQIIALKLPLHHPNCRWFPRSDVQAHCYRPCL
jgi:hypothetical protein